jgi:hypothetical protein
MVLPGQLLLEERRPHTGKKLLQICSQQDAWGCEVGAQGLNKKTLQQLSMLERRIAKGSPDEAETVEESIRHAKQAVTLDIKDGQSWCNLLI